MSAPSGVSHIALVTGDLDGFRTFYEDTIGLRTTIVFGGGPGHSRQAILMAGDAMLHVFEVANDQTTTPTGMFERGRLDHLGFTVTDLFALRTIRDRLLASVQGFLAVQDDDIALLVARHTRPAV